MADPLPLGLPPAAGRILPLLPLVVVFLVYVPCLESGFVWLDELEILQGRLIVTSLADAAEIFADDHNYRGYHRPFYNLLHSIDAAIWGSSPFGFHLSSLILHLVNVLLAYLVVRGIGFSNLSSAAIAGLWGLHPVNSAVVGLIHAKADLFVATALLASGLLLQRILQDEGARPALWLASLGLYLIGLLTKEIAFLYPVAVSLVSYGVARGSDARVRSRMSTYAVFSWIATVPVAVLRLAVTPPSTYASVLPLWERIATFGVVYGEYLWKLTIPVDLSVADTVTRHTALSPGEQLGSILLFSCLVSGQIVAAFRWPRLRKWIIAYNLCLLPVSQIVPILHFRADRFLYLPSLAFVGAFVDGIGGLRGRERVFVPRLAALVMLVLVALLYSGLVRDRLAVFESDQTLFQDEVSRTPDYREGLCTLGRDYARRKDYAQGEEYYRRCLEQHPGRISFADEAAAVIGLSFNLIAQNRAAEAYEVIKSRTWQVSTLEDREELSYLRAVAAFKLDRYAEALPLFLAYATSHPEDSSCRFLTGVCAYRLGRDEVAREALEAYLALRPDATDRESVERILEAIESRRAPGLTR